MKEKLFKRGVKVNHANLLIYHKRVQERKLKIKQKLNKNKVLSGCTFKPKTIDYQPKGKKHSKINNNFNNDLF